MIAIPRPIWTPWAKPKPRLNPFKAWFNAMADHLKYGTGGHLTYKSSGGHLVYCAPSGCNICETDSPSSLTVSISGTTWTTGCNIFSVGYTKKTGAIDGTFTVPYLSSSAAACIFFGTYSAFATSESGYADGTCTGVHSHLDFDTVKLFFDLTPGGESVTLDVFNSTLVNAAFHGVTSSWLPGDPCPLVISNSFSSEDNFKAGGGTGTITL